MPQNSFSSGGTFIGPVDSSLTKQIQIIHFANKLGVVFPAQYGKEMFGNTAWAKNIIFFTPDTSLIKQINTEIGIQYCSAVKKYYEKGMANMGEVYCKYWQARLPYCDMQFMGHITPLGEKIIVIKVLDFSEDPKHLKPFLITSWIDGWHGWFNSNTMELNFHPEKNLITIAEDI